MRKIALTLSFLCLYLFGIGQSLDLLKAPQSPAFQLLGVEPSSIERPSDPTDLIASVRQGTDDFTRFPSNYALEMAPFHLTRKSQFNRIDKFLRDNSVGNNVAQSFLISVGTTTQKSQVWNRDNSRAAVGFKFSLLRGKADTAVLWGSKDLKKVGKITALVGAKSVEIHNNDPEYVRLDTIQQNLINPARHFGKKNMDSTLTFAAKRIDTITDLYYELLSNYKRQLEKLPNKSDSVRAYMSYANTILEKERLWKNVKDSISINQGQIRKDLLSNIGDEMDKVVNTIVVTISRLTTTSNPKRTNVDVIIDGLKSELERRNTLLLINTLKDNTINKLGKAQIEIDRIDSDKKEAKKYLDLMRKRSLIIDSLVNDELRDTLEVYENTLTHLKVDRYGWKLDIAAGATIDFPTQKFDSVFATNMGFWITGGYEGKKGNSGFAMLRLLGNPNEFYKGSDSLPTSRATLYCDLGLKYIFTTTKGFSIQAEALMRKSCLQASNKVADDWKLDLTMSYQIKANQLISLTFGRDFNRNVSQQVQNLLLALNFAIGIGSSREIVDKPK
jgi:hypothetical protein